MNNANTFVRTCVLAPLLVSSVAWADVNHTENPDIVGDVFSVQVVCLNNDGDLVSITECDGGAMDEGGFVSGGLDWVAGSPSGIRGCGVGAVSPVSTAVCPLTSTIFAACTGNQWVLVQTTKADTYWAAQADGNCLAVSQLVPCRMSDSFDTATGCTAATSPPQVGIHGGYLKPDGITDLPPSADCSQGSHVGRMKVDGINNLMYLCSQGGWHAITLEPTI